MPIITVLLVWVLWMVNIVPFNVSNDLLNALRATHTARAYAERGDTQTAVATADAGLALFNKAIVAESFGTQEAREQWGEAAGTLVTAEWLPLEKRNEWYTAAVRELEKQKHIVPDDARFPFLLGALHHKAGNYEAAKGEFLAALELSPTKQGILVPLAIALANLGEYEDAIAYARHALELEESNSNARSAYVLVLIQADKAEEALALLRATPEDALTPSTLAAFARAGLNMHARRAWEIGTAHIQETNGSVNTDEIFILTQVYVQLGHIERAKQEVLFLQSTYPELTTLMQQALREIEQLQ